MIQQQTIKRLQKLTELNDTLVLPFYPLIYPLLNRCDLYLGDHSSVGYDVLPFEKPMVFLNPTSRSLSDKSTLLFQCGQTLSLKDFEKLPKKDSRGL